VFLIINNDQYEMKSIDKLQNRFLAGIYHEKRHKSNVELDAAVGLELLVSCKWWCTGILRPVHISRSKE